MKFLKTHKKEIIISLALVIFYFLLRIISLVNLPVFTDEAIYLRWAQVAGADASWRFISLTDGKQPLFIWATIVFMKFMDDPLFAGRLVSVFCGFFTLVGVFILTYELFKKKNMAFFAAFLYICYPFAQVYDRMALMDSMVATFSIWALYFSILLVRRLRLDIAYTLGAIIGGGLLTKSSNIFSIYLLPATLVLFDFNKKERGKRFLKWLGLVLVVVIISEGIYNILRLSPFFHIINEKNAIFVYPLGEWIKHPFAFLIGNTKGLVGWFLAYLNVYLVLIIFALFFNFKNFFREKIILLLYFIVPFFALAVFGRVIFPRFIFFMTISLLPLAALGLEELSSFISNKVKIAKTKLYFLLLILFVFYPLLVSLQFALNPKKAQIADADINQYIKGWPSGWGVMESVEFFREESKNGKIFIATQGTFGLMPHALEIYLKDNPNVQVKGYWPVEDALPSEVASLSSKMDVYFLFYQPCASCGEVGHAPVGFPLSKVKEIKKDESFMTIYKVNATPQ